MRTTLTLDEDVAVKLRAEMRRSGGTFRDIVNDTLRRGLTTRHATPPSKPFRIAPRDLGLRPGVSLDNIAELIAQIEGPAYR